MLEQQQKVRSPLSLQLFFLKTQFLLSTPWKRQSPASQPQQRCQCCAKAAFPVNTQTVLGTEACAETSANPASAQPRPGPGVGLLAASLRAKAPCIAFGFAILNHKMAALRGARRGLSPGREGLGRATKYEIEENM